MGLFDKGVPQDLQDIMDARERRWIRQQEILASQKKTLICYKLNIPGEIKNNEKIKKLFDEGLNYILQNLKSNKISIEYLDITNEDSGSEAYITVDETPQKTKLHMCYLEDNLGIGRLMDIDVLNTEGSSVSRKDFGLPSRKCLLCPKDAFECARNRTHSVEDLQEKIVEIYNGYFVAGKGKKR